PCRGACRTRPGANAVDHAASKRRISLLTATVCCIRIVTKRSGRNISPQTGYNAVADQWPKALPSSAAVHSAGIRETETLTTDSSFCTRRGFIGGLALGAVAFTVPGAFAEELLRTPEQTEGPFYPDKLPLDTDNDLLILNDGLTPAVGTVTHLTGKI